MASRKEQKEQLRLDRLERERAEAAGAIRRRRLGYVVAAGLVAAVVIALGAIALAGAGSDNSASSGRGWPSGSIPPRGEKDLDAAAKAAGCVLRDPPSQGRGHTTSPDAHVSYKSAPPTSGRHYSIPTHDGAYTAAPTPFEGLVHALEHGRVVYWFRPNAPAAVRGSLKKLFDEDRALTILTPDARPMPYEVAASAWTHLLGCAHYNARVPDALRAFRDAYRLKAPEYRPSAE